MAMRLRNRVLTTGATILLSSMLLTAISPEKYVVHADITFDEQGRVVHVSGEHALVYPMYKKDGTFVGAMPGSNLCSMYGTTDVNAAAERYASENGYIYVPKGTTDKSAYIAEKAGVSTPTSTETPIATKEEPQAEIKPEAKAEEKPKYEHGIYDGITEEALNAFDYFTADGVADSCYIQVKENAEQRTMPGSNISKTAANSEYGEVQFVNENEKVVYKFVFPQVKADADFSMELAPTIENVDEGIKVDFKDEKLYNMDLGFEVDFFFQTGKPNTKFFVYTSEADGLHEYSIITTDTDGFAGLTYTMVQEYTFSETDLIAAAEEAKAKEQAEAEAKRLEEEAKKAAEEEQIRQMESVAEQETEVTEVTEQDATEKKNDMAPVLIGLCVAVIIGVVIFLFRKSISKKQ